MVIASATNVAVDRVLSALVRSGFERVARVGSLRRIAAEVAGGEDATRTVLVLGGG